MTFDFTIIFILLGKKDDAKNLLVKIGTPKKGIKERKEWNISLFFLSEML